MPTSSASPAPSNRTSSSTTGSFLSFSKPPRIYLINDTPQPPERSLLSWQAEGFSVEYIHYNGDQKALTSTIKNLHKSLNVGEDFALIAYSQAATIALQTAEKPVAKLCALIAYYPTVLPKPTFKYPSLLKVVVHVAGLSQISPAPDMCEWKCYRYEQGEEGFAEEDMDEFEPVEADLAFSRTLRVVRSAFKQEVNLEEAVAENFKGKYETDIPEEGSLRAVRNMTAASPHLTIVPTLEGGIGRKRLEEFYRENFIPSLVDDFNIRLISRTIGVDRVVDEMIVSFTHTDDIDWILPGVPPTDKYVEIPVVCIVAVRGGKLVSEHMYWDQASVLVQVGLLDPKMVPKKLKNEGLKCLPVIGVEAAKQLVEPKPPRYNKLLKEHGLMDALDGVNGVNGSS